jgi:DNA-binding response OmpR family regulator
MPSDDAQRRHVLIIEDESSLAEEITAELSGLGYCARSVESVAEGLRHARSGEVWAFATNTRVRARGR